MGILVTKVAAENTLLLILSPPFVKSPYALTGLLRIRLTISVDSALHAKHLLSVDLLPSLWITEVGLLKMLLSQV